MDKSGSRIVEYVICFVRILISSREKLNLLYEYRDLFTDMAVRNNRSELAIANRHQER